MIFVWGATLAAGLLLILSPWLWPAGAVASRPASTGRIARLLEGAGYGHLPGKTLPAACAAGGIVAGAIVWLVVPVPALALVAVVIGALAPVALLRGRETGLRRRRRGMWPDVCDLLIASVRAGMALPDAVASLADSGPVALRPAFAQFGRDLAASGHFDSSAERLKSTLADPVADRIIETLRMARQVGGTELTAVLRALSTAVRADVALRAEVEARQSWIRGAAILGVVAPWVILGMLALRPEGAKAYGSAEGVVLIVAGALVSIVAFRIMVRIGRLPEPRRWFG